MPATMDRCRSNSSRRQGSIGGGLFAGRALIEPLLREQCRHVVDVQAVAHAGDGIVSEECGWILADEGLDVPVAVVVTGSRVPKDAEAQTTLPPSSFTILSPFFASRPFR
jgi:hypothetical protein